jgi:hypothetical protein
MSVHFNGRITKPPHLSEQHRIVIESGEKNPPTPRAEVDSDMGRG